MKGSIASDFGCRLWSSRGGCKAQCAVQSCKAAAVLDNRLPGAAVGPPPMHQHSHISTAEAALNRDLALSLSQPAQSACGRAKLRAGWCDVHVPLERQGATEAAHCRGNQTTVPKGPKYAQSHKFRGEE